MDLCWFQKVLRLVYCAFSQSVICTRLSSAKGNVLDCFKSSLVFAKQNGPGKIHTRNSRYKAIFYKRKDGTSRSF